MEYKEPDFLRGTFLWQVLGYQFSGPPPLDLLAPSALKDNNPWIIVAAVLERAKHGDFKTLPLLSECLRKFYDASLWSACGLLLGQASPSSYLKQVLADFHKELFEDADLATQEYISLMLPESLLLWTIPIMLDFYLKTTDPIKRDQRLGIVPLLMSDLLENGFGQISYGSLTDAEYQDLIGEKELFGLRLRREYLTDQEYRKLVMEKYEGLCTKFGSSEVPILYGELFSVKKLAERLYANLTAEKVESGVIMGERSIFEASTGIDCSGFYKEDRVQSLAAAAIVEDFLQSADVTKYQDGVRYFFGHRIPD